MKRWSRRCRGMNPGRSAVRNRRADEVLASSTGSTAKVIERLRKRRRHLLTFLFHPEVEATNNRAERALRPAVIARKLSCGNKTPRGVRTWEILASLAATCEQRLDSFVDLVAPRLRLDPIPVGR